MKSVAFALVAWLAVSAVQAQQLEFKGVPFGASAKQFNQSHPQFNCSERSCVQYRWASSEPTTFASETVNSIEASFYDVGLDSVIILFSPHSYGKIVEALQSKYGEATSIETGEFKTKGGMTAPQERRSWKLTVGESIEIRKFAGDINTGYLHMFTPAFEQREKARRQEQAQKAKKDI